jgi:hypothetical protein
MISDNQAFFQPLETFTDAAGPMTRRRSSHGGREPTIFGTFRAAVAGDRGRIKADSDHRGAVMHSGRDATVNPTGDQPAKGL